MKFKALFVVVVILSLIAAPLHTAAKIPGGDAAYGTASPWAEPELDKAAEYGFISDMIKDDMTKPITREEFARLSVSLYEKYTGKEATYEEMIKLALGNILDIIVFCKAFEVDFSTVDLTNLNKALYSPDANITREQIALLYHSAVKAMVPGAKKAVVKKESKFTDAKDISWWANDNAYFMIENGFMSSTDGKFDPKGTCSREMAVIIAVRIYEKYAEE